MHRSELIEIVVILGIGVVFSGLFYLSMFKLIGLM